MGSANKTKALQLPQWLGNEYFERLDMNGAFSNIEKAVATFDYLARTYGVSETYPDADTGTITATVGSGSPVTATRSTVVSEADGVTTYVETTTIDGEETVRTWTEGTTTASMEVGDE